jgi:hypothetical protein
LREILGQRPILHQRATEGVDAPPVPLKERREPGRIPRLLEPLNERPVIQIIGLIMYKRFSHRFFLLIQEIFFGLILSDFQPPPIIFRELGEFQRFCPRRPRRNTKGVIPIADCGLRIAD